MSGEAKTEIFTSIRKHLAASESFETIHPSRMEERPSVVPAGSDTNPLERFLESLELVGAKNAVVETGSEAASELRRIVDDLSATNVVVSDSDLVNRIAGSAQLDVIEYPSRDDLFASDVGVTSAQWAIAETGTLVLESSVERHRLVSLVPPVHVCILRASSIRESMAEILGIVDPVANPAITFITGASRTSDIELTLAIGVHGPGELYVIVINEG